MILDFPLCLIGIYYGEKNSLFKKRSEYKETKCIFETVMICVALKDQCDEYFEHGVICNPDSMLNMKAFSILAPHFVAQTIYAISNWSRSFFAT